MPSNLTLIIATNKNFNLIDLKYVKLMSLGKTHSARMVHVSVMTPSASSRAQELYVTVTLRSIILKPDGRAGTLIAS